MTKREVEQAISEAVAELPALVPLKDAAKFLGVSDRTLKRWEQVGRVRFLRTTRGRGGVVRVLRADLAKLLAAMVEPSPFRGDG